MKWIVLMLSCLLCGLALASDAGTDLAFSARASDSALPTGWKPYKMSRHAPKARMGIVETGSGNAYFDKVRTLVLQSGNAKAGQWQTQRRDLKADYRAAFGKPAPKVTGIALATDTDNTGSKATAWFGDIHLTPDTSESPTKESTP